MKAIVTNYGNTEFFPTCLGNILLARRIPRYDIVSIQALKELRKFHFVEVKVIEGSLDAPPIDYSRYSINQLRSIAKTRGYKTVFTARKADLIKFLTEETNAKR